MRFTETEKNERESNENLQVTKLRSDDIRQSPKEAAQTGESQGTTV